jgi:hypothetical protein
MKDDDSFAQTGLTAPSEILGSNDSETGAGKVCPLPPAPNSAPGRASRPQNLKRSPRGAHEQPELLIPDFEFRSLAIHHGGLRVPCVLGPNPYRCRPEMATHHLRGWSAPPGPEGIYADVWISTKHVALEGTVYRVLVTFAASTPLAGRRFLLAGRPGPIWTQYEIL